MPAISSLGSSSGLPLEKLLQDLAAVRAERLNPLNNQKTTYSEQLSAYGILKNALWKLETSTASLRQSTLFKSTQITSNNTAFSAALTDTASSGNWQISVQALAEAQSLRITTGQADSTQTLGSITGGNRTLTITQPGQMQTQPVSVTLSDSNTSLNAIRDAINSQLGSINAAVVQGSDNLNYLTLTAKNTGTEAEMEISVAGDAQLAAILDYSSIAGSGNMTVAVAASDAAFTFNGISMSGQSNTISNVPSGVTLTLLSQSPVGTAEQLQIKQDTSPARKAVQNFVTDYNAFQDHIAYLTRYQPGSSKNGELLGEGTVRNIQAQLTSLLNTVQNGNGINYLTDLGVGFNETGRLIINYYKMGKALSEQPDNVISFLTGNNSTTGFATQIDNFLYRTLSISNGNIKIATDAINRRIRAVEDQIMNTIAQNEKETAKLRQQFINLDKMVSNLNSTSDFLTQQFKIINGTRG